MLGVEAAQVGAERQSAVNKRDAAECVAVRAALAVAALAGAGDILGIAHFPVGTGLEFFSRQLEYSPFLPASRPVVVITA